MTYGSNIHRRRSIRLKGYDYSQSGLYFITICTQNRECLFGNVVNKKMILNDAAQMIGKWYDELENKYPDKKCHERIVMPNHFHCIIENIPGAHVGAPPRGRPIIPDRGRPIIPDRGRPNIPDRGRPNIPNGNPETKYGPTNQKYNATVGDAMDWFKTMTTNEYIRGVKNFNWKRFDGKLWQRNYWEHIIREEAEYKRIANYITDNPGKWIDDVLNSENPK